MYQICFYVPEENLEAVKNAMFKAGAGEFNHYTNCAWQCLGRGQFKPTKDANPTIGQKEQLKVMNEYKVEIICADKRLELVIKAMKKAHPYEEVAYAIIKMEQAGA